MKKYLIVILSVYIVFSCGGKKEHEVISAEDFMGETGIVENDSDTVVITPIIENDFDQFAANMVLDYDTALHTEFNMMDRFTFSTSRKLKFTGKKDVPYGSKGTMVTPIAEVYYYTFSDTLTAKNALYNYLDNMAVEGEGGPVKLQEDVESIKMAPMWFIMYDTVMIDVQYKCEHEKNDWRSFQDSIIKVFGKDYLYIMDVDCGGPLRWK